MSVRIEHGCSREVVKTLADGSVDSCVTDPPYGIAFMGRAWDAANTTAFDPAFWIDILRVLKPGGYLAAFGGTRSSHRLVCAIEDAGFEIRDSISYLYDGGIDGPLLWTYGSGFPKSHDTGKALDASEKRCSCHQNLRNVRGTMGSRDPLSSGQKPDLWASVRAGGDLVLQSGTRAEAAHELRHLREEDQNAAAVEDAGGRDRVLQQELLGQDASRAYAIDQRDGTRCDHAGRAASRSDARSEEPSLEGRGDLSEAQGKLCVGEVRPLPSRVLADGAEGRLCDGTSPRDGEADRPISAAHRVRSSQRSQAAQQCAEQSRALARQPQPQDGGAWPHCGRCGKPIVPNGLGTALKPAFEPICLARKPLSGTVAQTVLQHGTGALNIDGCRVEGNPAAWGTSTPSEGYRLHKRAHVAPPSTNGRWPANLVHDGSEEVLAEFAKYGDDKGGRWGAPSEVASRGFGGAIPPGASQARAMGDTGSAARFFFSAKAGADDRCDSKHPTVKPVALMRWLARLITPPGGLVLDPFAGSGTTGVACIREGFDAILIEREAEYVRDIRHRIDKLSGLDAPLFARVAP